MSILTTIIPKAEQLAINSLKGGRFDADAFLVLSMIELLRSEQVARVPDRVPESTIDEQIDSMQDYFVEYMRTRSKDSLVRMMLQTEQILCELYQSLSDTDEILAYREFIKRLQKIID